ncbi:MAG: aminotransferase class V-fold PLP-dependent enzyme, partial [bacterium]|nr:aminotransferase class V-fold PLP-dependent enzyme [bacterium]
ARESLARHLGCKARELIFVSGLTEANNIALIGFARGLELRKRSLTGTHWIVSSIEHSSVLECFAEIERMGGTVSHVEPDAKGIVRAGSVAALLRPATVLVSVGWGNNEIGTVQPLAAIARAIRHYDKTTSLTCGHKSDLSGIIFHSDAGQAPLYRSPQVHSLGVDMLALGSGKLYGPRGIGCLYVNNRTSLSATIFGGGQERGLRSGTEDVALAAGFAAAFDEITTEREAEAKRLRILRDNFAASLRQGFGGQARDLGIVINGDLKHCLPHMLNISVPGERSGEYLVHALDHAGLALSTKSACREGEALSHVVLALGEGKSASSSVALAKEERAANTLRFSLGRGTTETELKRALEILTAIVHPNT